MHKIKQAKVLRGRDTYMELVQRFPLKTLKNDGEHERACAVMVSWS